MYITNVRQDEPLNNNMLLLMQRTGYGQEESMGENELSLVIEIFRKANVILVAKNKNVPFVV